MSQYRTSYREEEVRALIEDYQTFAQKKDVTRRGMRYLIALADLHRALKRLPLKFWEVVLLHGLLDMDQADAAELLQVSQQALSKRYRQAIEELVYTINGGA